MRKLEATAGHLVTASFKRELSQVNCEDCGAVITASVKDSYCPFCVSPLPELEADTVTSVEASSFDLDSTTRLKCSDCDTIIATDYPNDMAETLVAGMFCTVCGSEDLVETEEEQLLDDEDEELDDEDEEGAAQEELEEEITSKLEAAYLSLPEPTWMIFSNGAPIVSFCLSKQPEEAKAVFATEEYINIIKNKIATTSIAATAKEFNANILSKKKVLSMLDVEEVAYEKLQSTVLPKFTDCLNLAVLGMTKNVYPDLNSELKACFFDELKARNVSDASQVIESCFESAGTKVFEALIAKAMELFHKKDEALAEVKATITASSTVKSTVPVTAESLERKELKDKLIAGSIPVEDSEPAVQLKANKEMVQAGVTDVRSRISFKK